jgi:hypothetical protein
MAKGSRTARSHMPKGATQSPKGDLGARRGAEVRGAFPHAIKAAGRTGACAKTFKGGNS